MENAIIRSPRRRKWTDLSICANYFLVDSSENRYSDYTFLYLEERLRKVIKPDVWDRWCSVVNANINDLKTSSSFDELCRKLERLRFTGIGAETIISTAAQIAYKSENIIVDDSCWTIGYLQNASIVKKIKTRNDSVLEFCYENIPRFGELSLQTQVLSVIGFADIISRYIMNNCK